MSTTNSNKLTQVNSLKAMLDEESVQKQFKNALGKHKDSFVASIVELFSGDKGLQECQPSLLIKEALRAATLQLPLNKALGFAYIVKFNTSQRKADGSWERVPTPQFLLGYKGFIQLAMRTGQYKTINADFVYEGEYEGKDKLSGTFKLNGKKKSDKIVGYFCHFELLNGFSKTLYMTVEEMAKYAKLYSPSVGSKTSVLQLTEKAGSEAVSKKVGWEGNFNDMALKTVIRRLLSKYGYLSVEMQNAITSDVEASSKELEDTSHKNVKESIDVDDIPFEEVDTKEDEAPKALEAEETQEEKAEELPY